MARRVVLALVLVPVLALAAGCIATPQGSSTPPPSDATPPTNVLDACTAPVVVNTPSGGGQSSVSNHPGSFSYSGQAFGKAGKEDYLWANPSPTARASFGGQIATGTLHIVIKDACSVTKFDKTITTGQEGNYGALPEGRPGNWLITLEFTAFTGQLGLTVTS